MKQLIGPGWLLLTDQQSATSDTDLELVRQGYV